VNQQTAQIGIALLTDTEQSHIIETRADSHRFRRTVEKLQKKKS